MGLRINLAKGRSIEVAGHRIEFDRPVRLHLPNYTPVKIFNADGTLRRDLGNQKEKAE